MSSNARIWFADHLRRQLRREEEGLHGAADRQPQKGVRAAAVRAQLLQEDEWEPDRAVTPYTLRRTMARLLRGRGVPMEQIAGMLGHSVRQHGTTEIYADADPAYLAIARDAIDAIFTELDALTTRALKPAPKAVCDQTATKGALGD